MSEDLTKQETYRALYGVRVAEEYSHVPTALLPPKALGLGLVQDTSAHGIPHIFRARGIIKRILWLLFFLIATGYLIYSIYSLTDEYLDYDVTVKVTMETASSLTFPAVTVCNQNMIRKSKITETELASFFVDTLTSEAERYDTDPFDDDYDQNYFGSEADEDSEITDTITKWIALKTDEEQYALGHQLDDLILDCTYAKYPCNASLCSILSVDNLLAISNLYQL